jgi:hypothetical protein
VPRRRTLSVLDRDRLVRDAVATIPGPVADRLLEAIMAPPDERAALIGRLYSDPATRNFAELLIDLEEDGQLGLDFAQALKDNGLPDQRL